MSYADIAGISLDNPDPIVARPDDRVTVGESRAPVWVVVAANDDTAWVRREDQPSVQGLTPVSRLRRAA